MNTQSPSTQFLAAGEMENCFRESADLLERYLVEGTFRSEKAADIAITHLVARSLTDLRWGQYLASAGYPIQMYSVIRPVSEALNLIELFAQDPARADEWAAGEYQKFTPAHVREALGIERDDVHSWMCELSHPRFAGFQLTTYKVVRDAEEEERGLMKLGELPFEIPPVLLATTMPGLGLMNLTLVGGHLVVKEEVAATWPSVLRGVGETLEPGFRAVDEALPAVEQGEVGEVRERLGEALAKAIKAARELEQMADEAKKESGGE